MQPRYEEYATAKLLRVPKHVGGPYFWDKYTAHPYIGCRNGCEFCYLRGEPYLGRRDPATGIARWLDQGAPERRP